MSKRCKCFWAKSRTDEKCTGGWSRKLDKRWLTPSRMALQGKNPSEVVRQWHGVSITAGDLSKLSEGDFMPESVSLNPAILIIIELLKLLLLHLWWQFVSYAAWRQIADRCRSADWQAELDMFSTASQAECGMQIVKWYWEWLKSRHSAQQKTSFHPFFGDCLFLAPDLASEFYGRPCFWKSSLIMSQ